MGTKRFYLVTWPWCLTLLSKTLTLAYNFQVVCTRMLIFHMNVPCDKIFSWVPKFWLKTLTLAITFKWYVLGCWYFTWVFLVTRSFHGYQHLWPWPWCLTLLSKTLTLAITFKWYVLGCWYFKWVFLVTRSFHRYQIFLTLWPWPWCLTILLKTLTLAITFKWYVLGCWYFTWVFLETRSFHGYQTFWPCDFELGVWSTY
jgi:hypothetical protein